MLKTLCFGKGGLASCISRFIRAGKLIREKYTEFTKMHNLENLVLIAKDEKKIRINRGVSNVYTFSQEDFKGVEFYAARRYVHLTKYGREEDLFFSDEEE